MGLYLISEMEKKDIYILFKILMETSSESEDELVQVQRRRPTFRDRINWHNFSSAVFRENFRCRPEHAEILLQLVGEDLQPKYFSNHALTAKEKLLIALRFFADNDDYHAVGSAERKESYFLD